MSCRRREVLTQREEDILILVGRGMTNREIAENLCTSISNIKLYIHRVCIKLGVANRQQAVIEAVRTGVLVPRDIYSVEEIAQLLAYLGIEAIEAVSPLLKLKLDQVKTRSLFD